MLLVADPEELMRNTGIEEDWSPLGVEGHWNIGVKRLVWHYGLKVITV